MNVTYLHDEDLDFLQHCSEEQLADFARLLTHNEKGKARLSSVLSHNELFKAMEGHPEQHRRNWRLIAGEFQHYGGQYRQQITRTRKTVPRDSAGCRKTAKTQNR